MKHSDTSIPPLASGENPKPAELTAQCIMRRLKFWGFVAGLPLLLVLALQTLQIIRLRRELQTLRAQTVQFGQGVEIYNPAWGTVIDGVDPARFPSRDA